MQTPPLTDLALDAQGELPLYRQLVEQLRRRILVGELPGGSRLPPSRELAARLGVGRITVSRAYERLGEDGFLEARVGAGTFVRRLPLPQGSGSEDPARLTPWGRRLLTTAAAGPEPAGARPPIDFGFGRTFPSIFPYDVWRRLLARYLSTDDALLSRYGSPAGFGPLREAIAAYLERARAVRCSPEQVIVVSGAGQAMDLLARLCLAPGDAVLMETPGYADAGDVFRLHGARLVGVPVDDAGLPAELLGPEHAARLAFVTPAHQFPRGGALPLARRLRLLAWAAEHGALIVEDDYDSELRYRGQPPPALQGLDQEGLVVYLGTFSKVLFPALRLGYVVLPQAMCEPFEAAMRYLGRGAPTLTQAAVADFLVEGHFERHVRRLREAYGARRRALVAALERHMGDSVRYSPDQAGLHVMVYLPPEVDEADFVRRVAAAGVGVYPGAQYHLPPGTPAPSILLGFSGLEEAEIEEGVRLLAGVLEGKTPNTLGVRSHS